MSFRKNPISSTSVNISKAVWSTIAGLTLFKEESYLLVADPVSMPFVP